MTATRIQVLLASVLVLLGGCRLDADVVVRLDADGGGDVRAVVAVDDELADALAAAGVDPLADVAAAADAEPGWRAQRADQRLELTRSANGPAELEDAIRQLAEGLDAAEVTALRPAQITLDEDTVGLQTTAGLRATDVVGELGVERETAVQVLRDAVDYRVHVQLPGDVLETTGQVVDGGDGVQAGSVVEWVVPVDEEVDVGVVGVRPRGSPWWTWAAAGLGVALLVGLLGLTVSRRRRRP